MNERLPDDAGLRAEFQHLRRLDARRGASFLRSWSAANRRVSVGRERSPGRTAYAAAALTVIVAAIVAWPEPQPNDETATAPLVAGWTAPSDVLLATPGRELWRNTPRLGDPLADWRSPENREQRR